MTFSYRHQFAIDPNCDLVHEAQERLHRLGVGQHVRSITRLTKASRFVI
jgi:hypothetical protein